MLSTIQDRIAELTRKFPSWDRDVAQFFEDSDSQNNIPNEEILDSFTDVLEQVLEYAKAEDGNYERAMSIFENYSCKEYVSRYIKLKLRTFENYKPLCDLAIKDIYKAKYCVDLLWTSYILRFNPHLVFDETVPLTEEQFKSVAMELDRFTDFCVDRGFCASAIAVELKENSGASEIICNYIAEKIDADFEKLKLNYVIHKISMCERAIDALSER